MNDILANKIEELRKEAGVLISELEQLENRRQMTEVRLHQISGAIHILDNILQEELSEAIKVNQR